MKKNMGNIDKAIRIVIALAVGALFFAGVIQGLLATILLVIAVVFLLTSFVGTCPLYLPFGISTQKKKS